MTILSEIIEEYKKESLNGDSVFEELEGDEFENRLQTLVLPHVPGSTVYVVATSWSDMVGVTTSNILQILNLREIGTTTYDPGENYSITTHMFVKIDENKKAGILVSGQNAESNEYYTLFEG